MSEKESKSEIEYLDEELGSEKIVEGGFDAKGYKGTKVKIASCKKAMVIDWYTGPAGDDNKPTYNPNSTAKKKILVVETTKLPKLDADNEPIKDTFTDKTVKLKLNYTKRINPVDGSIEWVISKAPQAKMWKFMRNQGANTVEELIGTIVVLDTEADDAGRHWLKIKV